MTADISLDPHLCSGCGGLCCRETPGVWIDPQRFLKIFSLPSPVLPVDLDLELARLHLTWRDLGGVPVPLPQSNDDGCLLLGPHGCRLSPDQRPCQCLALIPNPETLRQQELNCEMPDESRLIIARRRWGAYWEEQQHP